MIPQRAGAIAQMKTLLVVPWDRTRGVASVVENLARYLQAQGHGFSFFIPAGRLVLKRGTTKLGFSGVPSETRFPFRTAAPAY